MMMTALHQIGPAHWPKTTSLLLALLLLCPHHLAAASDTLDVPVLYLELKQASQALLSNVLPEPQDSGLQGARLGINDNNTTGRFLGHHYRLETLVSDDPEELQLKALQWSQQQSGLIITNVPASPLLAIQQSTSTHRALIFNAGSNDDALRTRDCRSGLLHTAVSRAMLTDGLAQFLVARRWKDWMLVTGQRKGDDAYGAAVQRSAKRFGAKIKDIRRWSFDTDLRRSAQQEIPPFTRGPDYDVLLVADEQGDVGEFIPYNTWLPRPVAGTQGLTPVGWHRAIEQWGAAQLQSRFQQLAQRPMTARDYAAWLAVRVIGEAVTRLGTKETGKLYAYMLSPTFDMAAFRGRKLSFRSWNGQLRQPIALVHPRALISQSPQTGFLHPVTDLDTLGFDQPEVSCPFHTTLEAFQ